MLQNLSVIHRSVIVAAMHEFNVLMRLICLKNIIENGQLKYCIHHAAG